MTLALAQLNYGGVTLGPSGVAGYSSLKGLSGLPNNRNGDVPRPNAAGLLAGYDFPGDREIDLTLNVTATPGGNTFQQNMALLRAAFQMSPTIGGGVNPPTSQVFLFNLDGTTRQVCARVRDFQVTVDSAYSLGYTSVPVMLDAVDPRIYDATLQTATVGLIVVSGGLSFPVGFPVGFGSQSGGFIYATNNGTTPCPPILTIAGPCQFPRIEDQTTGQTLTFQFNLGASDVLVVDCYSGEAILNGSASRLNTLAPGCFISDFVIGANETDTIGFYSSDTSATAATLTVSWRNCQI